MSKRTRDWLLLQPGERNTECPHHGGFCAYSAADVTRCPTCHVPWQHIEITRYHSCKRSKK